MSDNPLDRIPSFDRLSVRAAVVPDGEDPEAAVAAAGIVDPVILPVVFGESVPDRSFGDGFTPNLTAVLEFDQPVADASSAPSSDQASGAGGSAGSEPTARASAPATANLPASYGSQALAPVGPHSAAGNIADRGTGAPPDLSHFPDAAPALPAIRAGS